MADTKKVAKKATPKKTTQKVATKKGATIQSELNRIQGAIKAPKGQKNEHGNFQFRSAEDICAAYKPLAGDTILQLNDELVELGTRVYVKAIATLLLGDEKVETVAYAREPDKFASMNEAQSTGSASSYARKYALNGLFAIDDTKDADTTPEEAEKEEKVKTVMEEHEANIMMIDDVTRLEEYWDAHKGDGLGAQFAKMVKRRKVNIVNAETIT